MSNDDEPRRRSKIGAVTSSPWAIWGTVLATIAGAGVDRYLKRDEAKDIAQVQWVALDATVKELQARDEAMRLQISDLEVKAARSSVAIDFLTEGQRARARAASSEFVGAPAPSPSAKPAGLPSLDALLQEKQ